MAKFTKEMIGKKVTFRGHDGKNYTAIIRKIGRGYVEISYQVIDRIDNEMHTLVTWVRGVDRDERLTLSAE